MEMVAFNTTLRGQTQELFNRLKNVVSTNVLPSYIQQYFLEWVLSFNFIINMILISYAVYLHYLLKSKGMFDKNSYKIVPSDEAIITRRKINELIEKNENQVKSLRSMNYEMGILKRKYNTLQNTINVSQQQQRRERFYSPVPPPVDHSKQQLPKTNREVEALEARIQTLKKELLKQRHMNMAFKYKYKRELSVETRDNASKRLFGLDNISPKNSSSSTSIHNTRTNMPNNNNNNNSSNNNLKQNKQGFKYKYNQ